MLDGVQQQMEADLASFDVRLQVELRSEVELLGEISYGLIGAGGKRVRPRLALLASYLLGAGQRAGLDVALCVELLHSASLLHDDLIDGADTRRGQETAYRRYGNSVSVMTGDFLLARVLKVLARAGRPTFIGLMADTAAQMCEAEVLQYQLAEAEQFQMNQYLRVIDGKTALLFAAALQGVAQQVAAPLAQEVALRDFGLHYGRAFQLRDDYLDVLADPAVTGKPAGGDLREGKATYPVLLLLEAGVAEAGEILRRRAKLPDDPARMAELIREHGTDEATNVRITQEARLAAEALEMFPESSAREALVALASAEAERTA